MRLIIDILKSILFGAMILTPTIILCFFTLCSEYGLVLFIFSFIIGDICRMKWGGITMFNVGDMVELVLFTDEINQIINDNPKLEEAITECLDKQIGVIVEVLKANNLRKDNYYVLDSNTNVCWKENELRLLNW